MEIRKMTIDDILFFNMVRSESHTYLHDQTNYTVEQNTDWFNNSNPKFFIVSVYNNDIGYFRTSEWTDNSLMVGMDIAIKYRGYGYAQKAYPTFISYLKKLNIKTIYLEVLEDNIRAKHIYDKLCFTVIDTKPHLGTNTIKMKLKI